jgi:hypothetical protein
VLLEANILKDRYIWPANDFEGLLDPAFFTVRTPRARTHQQQLACNAHHVPTVAAAVLLPCKIFTKFDLGSQ